jgi:hypothetical protein
MVDVAAGPWSLPALELTFALNTSRSVALFDLDQRSRVLQLPSRQYLR